MKATHRDVTLAALHEIATEVGCRIAQRSSYGAPPREHRRRDGRNEVSFTLRALYAEGRARPYRRLSTRTGRNGKPRTIVGVLCWHGHRDFMLRLFERYPDAILASHLARYEGRAGFLANYPETGETNIGSAMYPVRLSDVCYCHAPGFDGRGLPEA